MGIVAGKDRGDASLDHLGFVMGGHHHRHHWRPVRIDLLSRPTCMGQHEKRGRAHESHDQKQEERCLKQPVGLHQEPHVGPVKPGCQAVRRVHCHTARWSCQIVGGDKTCPGAFEFCQDDRKRGQRRGQRRLRQIEAHQLRPFDEDRADHSFGKGCRLFGIQGHPLAGRQADTPLILQRNQT